MYFQGEFRLIARLDILPLQAAVDQLTQEDWDCDTSRQASFRPHRKTQSIGLIYDSDMRHRQPTTRAAFARFRDAVEPIMSLIAESFASRVRQNLPPYFVRVVLVRLDAGEHIELHCDGDRSLARVHRVHVPVRTNPQVEFEVGGSIRHLAPGEAWEINNRVAHGVRNHGKTDRIHMILDYVVPGEIIHEPDAMLIA